MPNIPINTFNAGVLSPILSDRNDVGKYASGCKVLDNLIPLVWGCAEKRPGTKFIYTSTEPVFGEGINFLPTGDVEYGDDYQNVAADTTDTISCQTFTTGGAIDVVSVTLLLARFGTPGNLTVGIYAVDVDHKPTGATLGEISQSCDTIEEIGENTGQEQVTFTFSSSISLEASTEYAIVFALDVEPSGTVVYAWYSSITLYDDGDFGQSFDAGVNWYMSEGGSDFAFSVNV